MIRINDVHFMRCGPQPNELLLRDDLHIFYTEMYKRMKPNISLILLALFRL
jgi:hypothetical protein